MLTHFNCHGIAAWPLVIELTSFVFNPIIPPSLSHYQTAYTLPLQSLCWAPDRAQHTAIGLAKAFLSTSFYMITFASPISRLFSDSTKMETDANWLEYSPASRGKSSHSEDCGVSVGEQSHRAKEPRQHPRRPCPHQTMADFDGRCRKHHVPPLAYHALQWYHNCSTRKSRPWPPGVRDIITLVGKHLCNPCPRALTSWTRSHWHPTRQPVVKLSRPPLTIVWGYHCLLVLGPTSRQQPSHRRHRSW